jgi:hypothetical protein
MSMELLAISGKRPAIRFAHNIVINYSCLIAKRQDIHRACDESRTQKCSFTLFDSRPNSSLARLIVEPQVCPCLQRHRSIKQTAAAHALAVTP